MVEKFKISTSTRKSYVTTIMEGFELFRKYLAKHHPELDFANFDMEAIKKEVLFDR